MRILFVVLVMSVTLLVTGLSDTLGYLRQDDDFILLENETIRGEILNSSFTLVNNWTVMEIQVPDISGIDFNRKGLHCINLESGGMIRGFISDSKVLIRTGIRMRSFSRQLVNTIVFRKRTRRKIPETAFWVALDKDFLPLIPEAEELYLKEGKEKWARFEDLVSITMKKPGKYRFRSRFKKDFLAGIRDEYVSFKRLSGEDLSIHQNCITAMQKTKPILEPDRIATITMTDEDTGLKYEIRTLEDQQVLDIVSVADSSPFNGYLQKGDLIFRINNTSYRGGLLSEAIASGSFVLHVIRRDHVLQFKIIIRISSK